MKDYGSEEMRTAISTLAYFWRTNEAKGRSVRDAFEEQMRIDPVFAKLLGGYCRQLSAFFVNAGRLYEAGLISRRLLKLLISHPGLNVFYDVAVPINLVKNPSHNSGKYKERLKRVLDKHGNGIF